MPAQKLETYKTSVHVGKSLGTSLRPCLLQSTSVPRQEHLLGQALDGRPDTFEKDDSQMRTQHHKLTLCESASSCHIVLGLKPMSMIQETHNVWVAIWEVGEETKQRSKIQTHGTSLFVLLHCKHTLPPRYVRQCFWCETIETCVSRSLFRYKLKSHVRVLHTFPQATIVDVKKNSQLSLGAHPRLPDGLFWRHDRRAPPVGCGFFKKDTKNMGMIKYFVHFLCLNKIKWLSKADWIKIVLIFGY